jgi:hypothetical protein
MSSIRNILFILAGVIAWPLFTACEGGKSDDPRMVRAGVIIDSALSDAGLADEINAVLGIGRKELAREDISGEGFALSLTGNKLEIKGTGPAGVLYGSLEAARMIRKEKGMPTGFPVHEHPRMHMRGIGLLLMKLGTYNYPVTPEEFPFFYDRALWIETLDFLETNRYNYIAFWNGHPFSYFVDLPEYPEAQDGMEAGLVGRNREQLHWLIREAWKRNIRIFFEFYNIHTSVYFQEHHQLPDETREPSEQLEAYTSYSIGQFCREFPEAGLYITAGEGLDLEYSDRWVNEVIMPAIAISGSNPPVMLRSWFLDLENAGKITSRNPEIYIERKFNVEMIAGTEIDPANKAWDKLTGRSIVNIHMAANLEPFRWNPPAYIRACMQSSLEAGADGMHLYPRKSWRWPYGCDLGDDSYQWDRDRLWYQMWARYAWDPGRDSGTEKQFWTDRLKEDQLPENAARLILEAFELSADVLPAIQRLFWAGHDNHTVVTAGLLVAQIENAQGIPFLSLDPVIPVDEYLDAGQSTPAPGRISPDSLLGLKITDCELALAKMDEADQYIRVRIGNLGVIDGNAAGVPLTGKFMMSKGKHYPLEIVYDHANASAGHVKLKWKIGEQGEEVVDGKYMKHSRADLFRMDRKLIQPAFQTGT